MAYDYEISQPLHMVFRSSSLAVSLLLGFTLFRKSYSSPQVLGVLIVTLGIFVTTFADTRPVPLSQAASAASSSVACDGAIGCYAASMTQWLGFGASPRKLIGVGILLSGLFLSALLGHLQSLGYARWKKDESEAIFYQHFFSVLFFAPLTGQLAERAAFWSESDVFWTFGPISLTWLWFNVVGNLITQYICVKGVYLLVSTSGPVTATLVLTIRKFVSLIISILFFNNLWTFFHWIGTALVFGGAIVYSADSLWKK
jgi:UDP-xylose/UDP-N-acetylglucosamine transporter B4